MPESGHTWRQAFKGQPIEASSVRDWTRSRLDNEDAPLVANELFIAVLGCYDRRPDVIDMTISTADHRARITATGHQPLPILQIHGPGALIISRLSESSGASTDLHSLWAQLTTRSDHSKAQT